MSSADATPDVAGASPVPAPELEYKRNEHVRRLKRHLPLAANTQELYEELQSAVDRDRQAIPTRAHRFVSDLVCDNDVNLVILTGDAGHGKTHLCRRLLSEACAMTSAESLAALRDDPSGSLQRSRRDGGRPLRIIKDLSDFEPIERAADLLSELLDDTTSVAVVCANEGKLRAAIEAQPRTLRAIRESLDATVRCGRTSAGAGVEIINLNYQSVAGDGPTSFFAELVRKWVLDGRSWHVCRSCTAQAACSIYANRQALAIDETPGTLPFPVTRLVELVRVVEQAGYVLTIRESLMLLAYLLTGREDCASMHERHRLGRGTIATPTFWTHAFEHDLEPQELSKLPVLERFARLDPGKVAVRAVDDRLARDLDASEAAPARLKADLSRGPSGSRKEAQNEQRRIRELLREARRADFFRRADDAVSLWDRLGLAHYKDFARVTLEALPDAATRRAVRDRLVRGLHVVQGIRPQNETDLYLVDPAFGQGRGATSVVAARVPVPSVELRAQSLDWEARSKGALGRSVVASVDWLNRRIVVRLGEREEEALVLDLRQFEYLLRAGTGLAFQNFHAADVRRLLSRLALVLERRPVEPDRIIVMDGHVPRGISIDVDDTISVGEM